MRQHAVRSQLPWYVSPTGVVQNPMGIPGLQTSSFMAYPGSTMGVGMFGGGCESKPVIRSFMGSKVSGSRLLRKYMQALVSGLDSRGKSLGQEDLKKINEHLDKMQDLEEALLRTMCYIDEYSKLLDLFKDYHSDTLSEDSMKKFGKRYSYLLDKQLSTGDTLIDIFRQIQQALGSDMPTHTRRISLN